jgi:hypothetical protein
MNLSSDTLALDRRSDAAGAAFVVIAEFRVKPGKPCRRSSRSRRGR